MVLAGKSGQGGGTEPERERAGCERISDLTVLTLHFAETVPSWQAAELTKMQSFAAIRLERVRYSPARGCH